MPISRAQRTVVADRRTKLLQMRLAGVDYDTIADRLDYGSASAARKDFTRAMRETLELEAEKADELRTLELQRLDRLQAAAWADALKGNLRAIETVLKVVDRRCRLLGLDAPLRLDATVSEEPSAQDLELRDMINEAKARIAAEEQQLRGDR
jgi:hypothetical protein